MVKDLVVVGSGGLNIVRLIEDINANKKTYNFLGFLEKDPTKHGTEVLGYPILGGDDLLLSELKKCTVINNVMGTPRLHEIITLNLREKYGVNEFPNLIHPNVNMRGVTIGEGNIIYANSLLEPLCSIGDFNILFRAVVAHETEVGNYNLMAASTIGSRTKVGSYNLFGNGCFVANSCPVGDDNVIGVASVVMRPVKSGQRLLGNPAIDMGEFIHTYMRKKKNMNRYKS